MKINNSYKEIVQHIKKGEMIITENLINEFINERIQNKIENDIKSAVLTFEDNLVYVDIYVRKKMFLDHQLLELHFLYVTIYFNR